MNDIRWIVAQATRDGEVVGVFDPADGTLDIGYVNAVEDDTPLKINREDLPGLITMLQQVQGILNAEEAGLQ